MASHRRPKQPSRARVTVLSTAAAAAVAFSAQAANAAPSEKPSKDEVKAKVDALYEQAEQASEKLNGAQEKEQKLQKEISTIQDNVARGQQELNALRDSIGLAAAAQYRSGTIDSSLQLFLSSNPDDYLDKASTADQLSAQQVEACSLACLHASASVRPLWEVGQPRHHQANEWCRCRTRIGVRWPPVAASWARMRLVASIPSSCGIWMSIRTRS